MQPMVCDVQLAGELYM